MHLISSWCSSKHKTMRKIKLMNFQRIKLKDIILCQIDACWIITPQILMLMFCINWIAYLQHGDEFKDKQKKKFNILHKVYLILLYLLFWWHLIHKSLQGGVEPEHPHHEISNLQRVHNVQRTKLGYIFHQAKEPSGVWFLSQFTKKIHLCTYLLQRTITH
jgi:hypothetical protein